MEKWTALEDAEEFGIPIADSSIRDRDSEGTDAAEAASSRVPPRQQQQQQPPPQAAEPAAQEPSEAASKLDMALDDIGGEISREPAICRYFTSAGGCIYGDNCWFSHVLPAPAPPAAPEAAREDSAEVPAADPEDGSNADADSDADTEPVEESVEVCGEWNRPMWGGDGASGGPLPGLSASQWSQLAGRLRGPDGVFMQHLTRDNGVQVLLTPIPDGADDAAADVQPRVALLAPTKETMEFALAMVRNLIGTLLPDFLEETGGPVSIAADDDAAAGEQGDPAAQAASFLQGLESDGAPAFVIDTQGDRSSPDAEPGEEGAAEADGDAEAAPSTGDAGSDAGSDDVGDDASDEAAMLAVMTKVIQPSRWARREKLLKLGQELDRLVQTAAC